jgi:hypothetical protein
MSGGITQLVATGVQDAYLSGSPEVSFFRSSYKRYTHFASTVERQLIQGTPGNNGTSTVRFEKKGDLLSHVYITANDIKGASIPNINWTSVIDKIELLIGGQIIDTQDSFFSESIEPVTGAQSFSNRYIQADDTANPFYPLKFFFCKDWQSALPLVALQYHDVELRITWKTVTASQLYTVWSRFIYLDKEEREYFAKKSHDLLITQVNRSTINSDTYNYEFALSQPVKYIAFLANDYKAKYDGGDPAKAVAQGWTFKIQINGNDIGETKTLDHWVNVNQYYMTPFGYKSDGTLRNIAIIPFCLDTAKLQPTGTINFSRIDTFRLIAPPGTFFRNSGDSSDGTTTTNGIVNAKCQYFYSVNYNILRIQNGMAGILYAS